MDGAFAGLTYTTNELLTNDEGINYLSPSEQK